MQNEIEKADVLWTDKTHSAKFIEYISTLVTMPLKSTKYSVPSGARPMCAVDVIALIICNQV